MFCFFFFLIQIYKLKWIQDNYDTGSPSQFHPCALSQVKEKSWEKWVCRSEHPTSLTHVAVQTGESGPGTTCSTHS